MTKKRRILSTFLAASMVTACMAGMSVPASADPVGSTYSIVIPSTLTVANSGWNSIGNISATGTLEDGKKLNITATSLNDFALKSGDNSVTYTIKNASTDPEATISWDFTKEQLTAGATQAIGIDVEDYSTKPAGTYTDTVNFTASVSDAVVPVTSITLNKTNVTLLPIFNGESTETLTVSALPAEANESLTYSWESNNTSIATVDNGGVVTGVSGGKATITVKATGANGELSATCDVIVNGVATPGRGATNNLTVSGASAENPVYFTGAYTGSATTDSIPYSHGTYGSYDTLSFNGTQIYKGGWNVGSALVITGGDGTQSNPYVLERV